ncbi:MAG: hypothetical protein CL609_18350, partial [Anaerolineaceae bacterium]|nr:hypothetical protein [Anaerolineaceae bacterium]
GRLSKPRFLGGRSELNQLIWKEYEPLKQVFISVFALFILKIKDHSIEKEQTSRPNPYFTVYQQHLCYFYVLLTKLSMHLPDGYRIMKSIIVIHGKVTMGLITWIIIGAAVGWLANRIRKSDKSTINLECILAGMAGGTIGGLLTNVFYPPGGLNINFTWQTAISAAIGSFFVLMAYFVFERKQKI